MHARTTDLEQARVLCLFFFQAEDGIRDLTVTGVQTCALPILADTKRNKLRSALEDYARSAEQAKLAHQDNPQIYYNIACVYSRLGDRDKAISSLDRKSVV